MFLKLAAQEYETVVTNASMTQLIHENQVPSISMNCTEMPWQACQAIYSGFVYDHGDVIFTAPDIFNQDFANKFSQGFPTATNSTSQIYDQRFLSLKNMDLLYWNTSNLDIAPYGEMSIATVPFNLTSCCAKTTIYTPCKLIFDVQIIVIVIICNAIKAICMFLVVVKADDYPLVTLGDAIASFLEYPDPTTKDMCLISKREVLDALPIPRKWKAGKESVAEQQYYAVSARSWGWVNLL